MSGLLIFFSSSFFVEGRKSWVGALSPPIFRRVIKIDVGEWGGLNWGERAPLSLSPKLEGISFC